MTGEETITLTRREYEALIERNGQLDDLLAARDADEGARVPHELALQIMRGMDPVRALRSHHGMTLRELSEGAGVSAGHISEIERGRRPGSAPALARIAAALDTTVDVLVSGRG